MLVSLADIDKAAKDIVSQFSEYRIFALNGEMGAGKTTFSKAFCKALGVDEEVNSPTFSIANIYMSATFGELYHFDFYRLKTSIEVFDIGFDDYIYSGQFCLIEWPDLILDSLPKPFVEIKIEHTAEADQRIILAHLIQ
jgi:tRNA threonylcarbamoyladenosine biosynthesis protein TsaE